MNISKNNAINLNANDLYCYRHKKQKINLFDSHPNDQILFNKNNSSSYDKNGNKKKNQINGIYIDNTIQKSEKIKNKKKTRNEKNENKTKNRKNKKNMIHHIPNTTINSNNFIKNFIPSGIKIPINFSNLSFNNSNNVDTNQYSRLGSIPNTNYEDFYNNNHSTNNHDNMNHLNNIINNYENNNDNNTIINLNQELKNKNNSKNSIKKSK